MAQVVWVSPTTSRDWIAFATRSWTKSGRAPSFTVSLDFTSRAASPQLADSTFDRRPPHLFGWRRWRGLRVPVGQQVPARRQRPEPAAELLRLAALHPQGTRPGRRHAYRLPADELPGWAIPRGRAAAHGRRDQQARQLAWRERARDPRCWVAKRPHHSRSRGRNSRSGPEGDRANHQARLHEV